MMILFKLLSLQYAQANPVDLAENFKNKQNPMKYLYTDQHEGRFFILFRT